MRDLKIGVIGAQGRFGQSLCRRLGRVVSQSITLISSTDKDSNKAIASQSDLVLVAVRPDQVEGVLREIAPHLKADAGVVSFAARYPLASIEKIVQRPSARGMGDPDGNMCAYLCGSGIAFEKIESLLPGLSRTKPLELRSDLEIDTYTVLLAHLMVVLSLLRSRSPFDQGDKHLEFLAREFSKFGREFRAEEFKGYRLRTYPEVFSIADLITPGGITEKVIDSLVWYDDDPEAVHRSVMLKLPKY